MVIIRTTFLVVVTTLVSESFIKWLGENEYLSVKIFKQIIANYDRNRVLTVTYSGAIYEQYESPFFTQY